MKKQLEASIIDNNIFYNLLQRGSSSSKNKHNFIIYDMSGGECLTDDFQNFISINEDVSKLLNQGKDESIKLTEIQKILSKEKEELFSKSKRYFNFLLVQPKDSEFISLFNHVLQSSQKINNQNQSEEDIKSNLLLHSGQVKIECDLLVNEIQKKLQENPDIEANCSQQVSNWRKAISFYKILRNNKINEIHILRESAQSFFNSYPFMHNYFINLNSASQQSYPNDMLFNRIYFGNWKHASNEEIINSIGITHIVNMTCEVDNYFASNQNITYLKINIDDEDTSNIQQHFKETYQFIASAISKPNNKILIHCAQGKSRSATIVCMYLMRTFNWSFEQTLKYVQDRREVANPNYGFLEQLKKFEQKQFMFDGESLDEFAQSKKQIHLNQVESNESNNVKKQFIQNFEQAVADDIEIVQ